MKQYEDDICRLLQKKYRLKFEDANFAKGLIPIKILLDRTRNIHSYFVVCDYQNDCLKSCYWDDNTFESSIKSMLALQYSDLDRPLFFIFYLAKDLKIIEGNLIREAILENNKLDIQEFMLNNADNFSDVVLPISKEL